MVRCYTDGPAAEKGEYRCPHANPQTSRTPKSSYTQRNIRGHRTPVFHAKAVRAPSNLWPTGHGQDARFGKPAGPSGTTGHMRGLPGHENNRFSWRNL